MINPTMTESQFTRLVINMARLFGWRAAHFRAAQAKSGRWLTAVQGDGAGFPDLVLIRERLIVAELKVGRNTATPAQIDWLERFRSAGIPAFVWRPADLPEIEVVLRGDPWRRVDPPPGTGGYCGHGAQEEGPTKADS